MVKREATHAGSWYSGNGLTLSRELDGWLNAVTTTETGHELPQSHARAIIAPHAGYSYSGPAAAWAYKSLDLSKAKRVFLLGPSHHKYLTDCALTRCSHYSTPLGDLVVDETTSAELRETGRFSDMSRSTDENEHSLELHLPYIYKVLSKHFSDSKDFPKLVPVLVGNTSAAKEREYGSIFAPYLQDDTSIFVISSDFCHWGQRFQYTYYLPSPTTSVSEGIELRRSNAPNKDHPIHASIAVVDKACMKAIESGNFNNYRKIVDETGNTICGRHPIGIMMCAFEKLQETGHLSGESSRFEFVRYERSSDCEKLSDSSVSYASAFARAQVQS